MSATAPGIHVTFTAWGFRASSRTYARTRSSWGLEQGSPVARAEASEASGAVPDAPVARGSGEPDAEARAASRARASSAAVGAGGRETTPAGGGWSPDEGSGACARRGASSRATLARFAAWSASRSSRRSTNAPTGAARVDAGASGFRGAGRFVLDVAMTIAFSSSSSSTTTSTLEGLPADGGAPISNLFPNANFARRTASSPPSDASAEFPTTRASAGPGLALGTFAASPNTPISSRASRSGARREGCQDSRPLVVDGSFKPWLSCFSETQISRFRDLARLSRRLPRRSLSPISLRPTSRDDGLEEPTRPVVLPRG